ncbi:urea ABC transporter ATP-binding protein UrtD [Spongisporangium articulatum]|uniref:Urea ABC transporter ATP-binding protein UrtD n=1 Tax=Spongisporangium articulatum TaxID=3362603 RepID=A0ABW8AGE6_9ACTN
MTDQIFAGLKIRDLKVVFDGFVAVGGVDLEVPRNDIRFLIGPNGAGKTTIVDAVTGLVKSTGTIEFGEQKLHGKKVHQIARMGIGRTFQTATVFEELSVLQNLDIAAGAGRGVMTMLRKRKGVPEEVAEALDTIKLTKQLNTPAGILSHGQKQWLEIGMLLVQDSKLLLLDEPVAGMSHDERDATGELLNEIAGTRTVVVVEHDMDFMRKFARSVTVLHQGTKLSEGTVAEVQGDPKVQEVYLGQAATEEAIASGMVKEKA